MPTTRNARNRYQRLRSDDSDSSFAQRVEEYEDNEDQQQLLPPPPEPTENTTAQYLLKKFGWWALVIMFPYIFGPIIALRNAYSRSKRAYMAARYAHNSGYTDYLWSYLPAGAVQFVITTVWVVTMGKYDLTDFFERGFASSPRRRYNLRSRTRRESEEWDQNSQNEQYSSRQQLLPDEEEYEEENDRLQAPSGLFAPIVRGWRFIKMVADVFLLGLYTVFGWTFGRFVEEDGELIKKKNSRRSLSSRNGSMRSANGRIVEGETHKSSSKWPWIIVSIVLILLAFNLYSKYHHVDHKNGSHY